eukprot:6828058-Pyramimonas_sp.AAC.1
MDKTGISWRREEGQSKHRMRQGCSVHSSQGGRCHLLGNVMEERGGGRVDARCISDAHFSPHKPPRSFLCY